MDETLRNAVMEELVEKPFIDRLGLTESHFYGAVVQANDKLAAGDAMGALEDFSKLVLISPESASFQVGLAEAAIAAGMVDLGLQAASAVIMLEPQQPEGYFHSGKACFLMQEYALAIEDLTDAIAKCGTDTGYSDMIKACRALIIQAEAKAN